MKYHVYYNLHKKLWSCMHKGRVVGHRLDMILTDVVFKVREGGRQRVLREGKKNVHAFAVGEHRYTSPETLDGATLVSYNPYKGSTFFEVATGKPVIGAKVAYLVGNKVWAIDVEYQK